MAAQRGLDAREKSTLGPRKSRPSQVGRSQWLQREASAVTPKHARLHPKRLQLAVA